MKTWVRKTLTALKNLGMLILKGDLVLKMDKLLPHILVFVICATGCIWANLEFERTMVEREKNKAEIAELKIFCSQKVMELARTQQINNVDALLNELEVKIARPEKPASIVE